MALMFAIWSPQPNWMPRKPKLMFQICQKPSRGLSMGPSANAGMLLHRTVGELWTVGEAHRPRERLVRGVGADVHAARGKEPMPRDEHHAQARDRLAAPAHGRTAAMRAPLVLDLEAQQLVRAR